MVRPIGRIVSSCFLVSLWKGFGGVHGKTCALFHALDFSDEWQGEKETKMAVMQFRCPYCGQIVEGDESYRGKVAECPFCAKKIYVVDQIKAIVNVREGMFFKYYSVCCPKCYNVQYVKRLLKSSGMYHCEKCTHDFDFEEGVRSYKQYFQMSVGRKINELGIKIVEIDDNIAKIDMQLQVVGFYVQKCVFEEEWNFCQNPLVIETLKFQIEKLRTRLTCLNMEKIVNAQRSAQASGMMYSTTIGLRNPESNLYGLCRDVVQIKGWFDHMKSKKAEEALYDSTTDMERALARCEAAIDYYYELKLEFEGKQKEEARTQRLQKRCGCSDKTALPVIMMDESLSMKSKEELETMARCLYDKRGKLISTRESRRNAIITTIKQLFPSGTSRSWYGDWYIERLFPTGKKAKHIRIKKH